MTSYVAQPPTDISTKPCFQGLLVPIDRNADIMHDSGQKMTTSTLVSLNVTFRRSSEVTDIG